MSSLDEPPLSEIGITLWLIRQEYITDVNEGCLLAECSFLSIRYVAKDIDEIVSSTAT